MTQKQPEWERLAEALEFFWGPYQGPEEPNEMNAAAELRRLGKENEGYRTLVNNAVSGLKNEEARMAAVTHLVTQLHQAKGRYHTQNALCALFDAFGLSNTKPERKMK